MSGAPFWRRYLRLVRRDVAADVDDELAFHVAMRVERNLALGMAPEAARAEAMRRFGDVESVRGALVDHDARRERSRDRREYLGDVLQDLRFGARALRRAPGFGTAAILTLALAIGANIAIFSVVDALLVRPLPYARPEALVALGGGSTGEYLALEERLRSLSSLALYATQTHPIDDGHVAHRLEGAAITTNLLGTLGVTPLLGRGFTTDDGRFGNANVLLLSHELWQRQFGGTPSVIGTRVLVEGVPSTIIGVMGPDFHFPSAAVQYWQPYAINRANVGYIWAVGGRRFIGRLAPGTSLAAANREVRDVWPTLRTLNPLWQPGPEYRQDASVAPLRDDVIGTAGRTVWLLFGCVLLVLLIGCVNVANLLLARATVRARELAVRAALGGGRGRLIRQLVTESLLLSGIGATLGVVLALGAVRAMVSSLPASVPRVQEIAVNGTVLLFTALIALVAGLAFGIVPALRATRLAGANVARSGGARSTSGAAHHRLTAGLVIGEMALAVVLVIGATLLVRSFRTLSATPTGFDAERVVAARLTPPAAAYQDSSRVAAFYTTVLERLGATPGIQRVAAVDRLPLAQPIYGVALRVEGQFEDGTRPLPDIGHLQQITPAYFAALGIPLRAGRAFSDADRADQPPVAIVSESVARRFWPDGSAVGRRIGYPWPSPWLTVVGVVPDIRQDSLRDTLATSIYVPWRQRTRMSGTEMWVVARGTGDPGAIAASVRRIVAEADRAVPVSDVRTMRAVVDASMSQARFTTVLVGAFALAALVLGAIGIYGVMSYLVSQRTQEMGVRLALGAQRSQVIGMIVARAAWLAGIGAVIGVGVALIATRALGALLFGVSATDPLTFVGVPLLFLTVAAAASFAPARRATRVDPVRALRAE